MKKKRKSKKTVKKTKKLKTVKKQKNKTSYLIPLFVSVLVIASLIILVFAVYPSLKKSQEVTSESEPDTGSAESDTLEIPEEEEPVIEEETEPEPEEEIDIYELSQEEYQKAADKIMNDRYLVSTSSKRLSLGDTFVFGFGIHNFYSEPYTFRPVVEVKKVETMQAGMTNKVSFDEETLKTWIEKEFFDNITVQGSGYKIVPLVLTVGPEKAPDDPTVPGSYYFTIKVEYFDPKYEWWEEYFDFAKKTLHIRVEE
ncbi:hypothetical protein JXB41_07185 [Candidatus Woesearchaeota archaeon]|nr:hypothetical protein [Candidatus Woesearchaeota archaeon]